MSTFYERVPEGVASLRQLGAGEEDERPAALRRGALRSRNAAAIYKGLEIPSYTSSHCQHPSASLSCARHDPPPTLPNFPSVLLAVLNVVLAGLLLTVHFFSSVSAARGRPAESIETHSLAWAPRHPPSRWPRVSTVPDIPRDPAAARRPRPRPRRYHSRPRPPRTLIYRPQFPLNQPLSSLTTPRSLARSLYENEVLSREYSLDITSQDGGY